MGSEGAGGGEGWSDLSGMPRVTPRTTKREASEDTALTQARVHEASKGTFRNVRVKGNQESSEIPGKGAPPTACLGESGQQRRGWVHSTETPRAPPRRATGPLGGSGGTDLARKGDSGFLGETGSETERLALLTGQGVPEARWSGEPNGNPVNSGRSQGRSGEGGRQESCSPEQPQGIAALSGTGPNEVPPGAGATGRARGEGRCRRQPLQSLAEAACHRTFEKGPEAHVSNLKEQSQDPEDKTRERTLTGCRCTHSTSHVGLP